MGGDDGDDDDGDPLHGTASCLHCDEKPEFPVDTQNRAGGAWHGMVNSESRGFADFRKN